MEDANEMTPVLEPRYRDVSMKWDQTQLIAPVHTGSIPVSRTKKPSARKRLMGRNKF